MGRIRAISGTVKGPAIRGAQLAEVPCPFQIGWYARVCRSEAVLTYTFVVKKEKGFIFYDWSADCAAKVILAKRRPGVTIEITEPVVGIEFFIAQEFVQAAMEFVRARAGNHVDYCRASKTKLRTKVRLLDFEFFNRID